MFLQVAVTAIGIGVVVMVGYVVVQEVRDALTVSDTATNDSINDAKDTVFSGFSLIVIGIIVLAAFGLVSIFR